MPSHDGHTRVASHGRRALQHLDQEIERELLHRPGHQVQRGDGAAAHGVHIGEGVRRGDPPPVEGVVDDRREEVDGLDQGGTAGQHVHPRVVAGRW